MPLAIFMEFDLNEDGEKKHNWKINIVFEGKPY